MKSEDDEPKTASRKKPYDVPRLITYGNVVEISQAAGTLNQSDGGGPILTKTS